MKIMKRLFVLALPLLLAAFPLAAGGAKADSSGTGSGAGGGSSGTAGKITYPMKTDVTISWWEDLTANLSGNYVNLADTPYAKGLLERTGIKVAYQHPASGSANEQFNLMIADGNFPDVILRNWLNYPGGPEKALADGVIIRLNEVFEKYCPNLTAVLKAHPEWDKMIKTDDGSYYVFPYFRGDVKLCVFQGIQVRQDWLDELGLAVPTTFDEWHTVLTAFKQKKNASAPLTFIYSSPGFVYGYNIERGFYRGSDNKVHYGMIEQGYNDYLRTMAQWYKEGLLDPDIATVTGSQITAKLTSGASGASIGQVGSQMGTWTNSGRLTNPKFTLTAAPTPVTRKGDTPQMGFIDNPYYGNGGVAITTDCKNIEVAARLLDWNYSAEGNMYSNFGVEGVSYNIINGYPTFTDEVMKNPKGWTVGQGIASYARSAYNGPLVQDLRYFEQYMALPEQKVSPDIWIVKDPYKHKLPPITPNQEESREFARIMSEVTTYTNEMSIKYILGTENLSSWDTYVNTIKRMGIDRAIEIQNAALARFNSR